MPEQTSDLEKLLEFLRHSRGFDFTGYKRASLERRISRRMTTVGCASYADYIDFLEVRPDEFAILFNTILINVTCFFRDASNWEYLAQSVVPDIIDRHLPGAPIRIWSAGCASGEEAYTLAIIFAEALGVDAFQTEVKIYATDLDDEALAKARQGTYGERDMAEVPAELREKYFELSDGSYSFRKDLRRHIIFGRHDLIQDAPISRIDLLVCRNTLMYFNAETQTKILARFQFALQDNGVLFLGRAETLMTHASTFAPIDLKRRISSKVASPNGARDRLLLLANAAGAAQSAPGADTRLRDAGFDAMPTAQLLVDLAGTLVVANERARAVFMVSTTDIGRPLQDLKISYRPAELRSALEQAHSTRRAIVLRDVEWPSIGGEMRWLDIHVSPLYEQLTGTALGASVAFNDITSSRRLHRELEQVNQALETAYEELQSTNEELETNNEELQSTAEELETTNEELQSTNEELETMNEELQSTNEELQTMNDELRIRGDELNQVNSFLESILTSLRGAVVVVDSDLRILVWNQGAEELWGLREDELRSKHVLGLDIGLPVERLKPLIQACLSGKRHASLTVDAINRRGRAISCRVTATPLTTRRQLIHGVILVMEDADTLIQPGPKRQGEAEASSA